MNRREFFKCAAACSILPTMAGTAGVEAADGESVRFCAFSDIHYSQGKFWPHPTYEWLDAILERAVKEKVDFVVHAGDMSFNPEKDKAYIDHYTDFKPVKTYHVVGNHEFEAGTPEAVQKVMRLENLYYFFDCKGFRFIALDPHYHLENGKLVHNHHRCSYRRDESPFSFCLPPEQLEWLKRTIENSPNPCVVILHEKIDNTAGGVHNAAEIRKIFTDANAKHPGRVRLVVNGHEHKDHFRILDNIAYLDLNSATYDVFGDFKPYPYPKEYREQCGASRCCIIWQRPLSAIITLTKAGRIKIEGSYGDYMYGVTPESVGLNRRTERPTTCRISDVDITLNY